MDSRQVYWKCYNYTTCELHKSNLPLYTEIDFLGSIRHALRNLSGDTSSEEIIVLWAEILAIYSRCDLTYETDRLVALMG